MQTKDILSMAVQAADDKKAENITALDMRGISLIADYFIICHANSEKQVQAIARGVKEVALENELEVKRMEGFDDARWVLLDLNDVVIHIFHRDERSYYNLEKLWGDASTIQLDKMLTSP